MTTLEHEITEVVDLTLPDGRRLNPAARGWSRHPLQNDTRRGPWGRHKRWDYWSIQFRDLVISGVVADIDYLGTSDIWWIDLASGREGGRAISRPGGRGFDLPPRFGARTVGTESKNYSCQWSGDERGDMHLRVRWTEKSGETGELDAVITRPEGDESLNVVIPWSDSVFQYTSKHQARPVTGRLKVGDRTWTFDDDAWGVLDIGRGRWPYSTRWNWGGGSGRTKEGVRLGIQIGGKWTVGTGFTENGIFVDGRLSKIGRELTWTYDWNAPLSPWRVVDPGGQIDIAITPRHDKHSVLDLKVLKRETHQVFGSWSGHVVDDDGRRHDVEGIFGFAEECRAKW